MSNKVGIVGLGFVGSSIKHSFYSKGIVSVCYDKYKNENKEIVFLLRCLDCPIIFLALPTPYDTNRGEYDKSALHEVCEYLNNRGYNGTVVIKSTIEPGSTEAFANEYIYLNIVHNPEFLTANTSYDDFHNQKHIVLGYSGLCKEGAIERIKEFYKKYYNNAVISVCTATESESMKIFANSFYSVKVQFFTEMYLTCNKIGCSYNLVKNMILNNGWVNPMHTNVPGPDGNISYGGMCLPKDTRALSSFMDRLNIPNEVIKSCANERDTMRNDS